MSKYDPSYLRLSYTQNGLLLNYENFRADLRSACQQYMQNDSHHGKLADSIDENLPSSAGGFATYCKPFVTLSDVMAQIDEKLNNLEKNIIYKSVTWNVIVECFYLTNRVAYQSFSYLISSNSSTVKKIEAYGLLSDVQTYKTLEAYKNETNYIKEQFLKADIAAEPIFNAFKELMAYNSRCEKSYDYGIRNKKDQYSYPQYSQCSVHGPGDNENHQRQLQKEVEYLSGQGYREHGFTYSRDFLGNPGGLRSYLSDKYDNQFRTNPAYRNFKCYSRYYWGEESGGNMLAIARNINVETLVATGYSCVEKNIYDS